MTKKDRLKAYLLESSSEDLDTLLIFAYNKKSAGVLYENEMGYPADRIVRKNKCDLPLHSPLDLPYIERDKAKCRAAGMYFEDDVTCEGCEALIDSSVCTCDYPLCDECGCSECSSDVPAALTDEEKKAIASLKRVAAKWPESLWLYSASGSLCVMKKNAEGERACNPNKDEGYNQKYQVGDIDLENDGGDW